MRRWLFAVSVVLIARDPTAQPIPRLAAQREVVVDGQTTDWKGINWLRVSTSGTVFVAEAAPRAVS